jgi:hypothetical protein
VQLGACLCGFLESVESGAKQEQDSKVFFVSGG